MSPPILVVAAQAERRDPATGQPRLFLARRSIAAGHGGLWELPGGKVEAGERPEEALLRELREELGAEARFLGPPRDYATTVGAKGFRFLVYPIDFLGEPFLRDAHDALVWALPEELSALPLAPLDGPAIAVWLSEQRSLLRSR